MGAVQRKRYLDNDSDNNVDLVSSHTNLASHGRTGKEGPFKGKVLKVPWVVMYLRARRYTVKAWCFLGSTVSSFNLHT